MSRYRRFILRFYQDAEDGRAPNPGGAAPPPPPPPQQPDLAQQVQNLAQRYGSLDAVGVQLLTENRDYREQIRQLQGRVPAEGAVVLTGEDAQHWQTYRTLGAPTDIQAAIAERDTARTELTTLQRSKAIADVAGVAGYKSSVLEKLPKADKLTFTIKDETENGQTVKRAYVKDGDTEELLTAYAEREWADFLPSLSDTSTAQRPTGTGYVRQGQGKAPVIDPIAVHSKKKGYALPSQRKD